MTETLRAPLTKANLKLLQGPRSESEDSESIVPMTLQQAKGSLYAYMVTLLKFPPEGPEFLKNDELYIAGLYDIRYRENGGPKQEPKPNLEDADYWIGKCMYFRERYFELRNANREPSPSLREWDASTLNPYQADQERIDEYIRGWERRKAYIEEWVESQHQGNRGADAECSRKAGMKRQRDHEDEAVEETEATKRRRRSRTRDLEPRKSSKLGKENKHAPPQPLRRSSRIAAQRSAICTDFTSSPGARRSARVKVYGVHTKPKANVKGS
ncbi:hypothetical protein SLS62_008511 [Diatrype stigma]|uniref:Uncharacterized protein n=1 Tax=Diatrype stigma TaxID=117547 RepID=A0AAN9UK05_9PEZI